MNNKNLLQRFNIYQKERFPIAILIFTTLAVVLSSAAVVIPTEDKISNYVLEIIISSITLILFLFHVRVIDEYRDFGFDSKYHAERPVQRGIISLKELFNLNIIGLIIQVMLNIYIAPRAFTFWLFSFGYTIIAGKDFFAGNWIRKRFFLYNIINMFQMLFLQFYLYALFNPIFSFSNPLLLAHFVFVIFNLALLEFARKMKTKSEETKGRDTYSSRLGMKKASMVFMIIYVIVFSIFSYMFFKIDGNLIYYLISLFFLNLITLSTVLYLLLKNKKSTKFLEGVSGLFYITMHLLLVLTKI